MTPAATDTIPNVSPPQDKLPAGIKIKQAELIMFTTQLSVMIESGVVLSDALDAICEQSKPGPFKMITADIAENIRGGESFSVALSAYPKVFSKMFISMVKASEASGKMSVMLEVLTGYLDGEAQTRKQVKSALTYPLMMVLMAISATGTLMFFVLPRFMKIYESRGTELPKLTRMLVGFSSILADFKAMTMILTTIIVAAVGLYFWYQSLSGRKVVDYIKVHTPVIGTMFIDTVITRGMRIMATMVNTGVSLLDAIEVIQGSCDNYYFQRLWQSVDDKIRAGYQLSDSITLAHNGRLIAPGIIQMLRAGEKSGQLGRVCDKISIFYEKKLQASIKNVTTLIEPVMVIIMGGVIGTIAIALLLPVFRISRVISH